MNGFDGGIDVYAVALHATESRLSELAALLDEQELRRARGIMSDDLRRRQIVASAALRLILSRQTGEPPRQIRLERTPLGKPVLAPGFLSGRLSFNLTHSYEMAFYCVSSEVDVGIDAEFRSQEVRWEELGDLFLAEPEKTVLSRAKDPVGTGYRIWTAKEAFLKGLGYGIATELKNVRLCDPPDRIEWLEAGQRRPPVVWSVRELRGFQDYVVTLAFSGPVSRIRIFDARSLVDGNNGRDNLSDPVLLEQLEK
jgi:4'-phosphopantetheinyl transferase